MGVRFIRSDCVNQAVSHAIYDRLEDGLLVGVKLGRTLPVLADMDLNKEPVRKPMDAV